MTQNGLLSDAAIIPAGAAALARSAREQLERIKGHWQEFWFELEDFHGHERWTALGYSSFKKCVEAELGISGAHAYRILEAAAVVTALRSHPGVTTATLTEKQARALVPLKEEPEQMAAAWQEAVATAPRDSHDAPRLTAAHVAAVVERVRSGDAFAPPETTSEAELVALDTGAQLLAVRRDLDQQLGRLHDLREALGARLQDHDLTRHDLARFRAGIRRLITATDALAAARALANQERTARGGARVHTRALPRGDARAPEPLLALERIEAAIAAQPRCTSYDIAAATGIIQGTVSARLTILHRTGRVTRSREKPYRYTLSRSPERAEGER